MKLKPHSPLPWVLEELHSSVLDIDLYNIKDAERDTIAGFEYISDVGYFLQAVNNYQEAVALLKWNLRFTKAIIQKVDNGYVWREASEIEKYVGEFLNKLND